MKPYLTTTVYFLLIIGIGIGHVHALPLTTHNQLVPREDFPTLKKSLYTRADDGVDSGRTEGPETDGEHERKKAKLDANSKHLAVPSETGTPKPRKPLPSFGRSREQAQMQIPRSERGKLGKKMIMTGLSTTADSQRKSLPNPLDESSPSGNVKSANSGDAGPTTSETAAPETLDTVKANAKNFVFQHRDTITATEARNLRKTMIDAQLETNNLPWKCEGVWSDEVLREMIQALRDYKSKVISKEYTKAQKEALKRGKKTSKHVGNMDRPDLEVELDGLWQWAVERNNEKGDRGSRDLVKIKEGGLDVNEKRLLWFLFRNVPMDTSDMSRMPWREAEFQWKPEWVKTLLMRIWSQQRDKNGTKFQEPDVRFNEKISSLEGEQREAAIKDAMDDAWKWWIEYSKNKKHSKLLNSSK